MPSTDTQNIHFQTIPETGKTIAAEKPDLQEAIASFGVLFTSSEKVQGSFAAWNIASLDMDKERLAQGESLLHIIPLVDFKEQIPAAASIMFSALSEAFAAIAGDVDKIRDAADTKAIDLYQCMLSLVAGEEEPLKRSSSDADVSYEVFAFVMGQLLSPFLRSQAKAFASAYDLSGWQKGYCPVCGAFPSVAYLVGEGGKRWLHCSQCGHEWRFARQACPYCEEKAPKGYEYFYVEDRMSERVYICKQCKKYLLSIDIRELVLKPNMDLAPVGLIPLDIKAQEQGYTPLADLPWNQFGK